MLQELGALDLFMSISADHCLQVNPGVCVFFSLASPASLLACGTCQGSAQMDITSLTGVVGQQSLLVIENTPVDVQEYSWHRGANDTEENLVISYNATSHSQQKGPMYSGRESVNPTGALLIEEPRINDTGHYTVRAAAISDTQRATGWLKVQGEWAAAPVSLR